MLFCLLSEFAAFHIFCLHCGLPQRLAVAMIVAEGRELIIRMFEPTNFGKFGTLVLATSFDQHVLCAK